MKNDTFGGLWSFGFLGVKTIRAVLNSFSNLLYFICALNSISPVGKLPWFHYPVILKIRFSARFILLSEFFELLIFKPVFYMIGQRYYLKQIGATDITVLFQNVKHSFLVTQDSVKRHMIVHNKGLFLILLDKFCIWWT